MVSALISINEVALHRARLLRGSVTACRQYITDHLVNSAFHPCGRGILPIYLAKMKAECVHLCRVGGNTVYVRRQVYATST